MRGIGLAAAIAIQMVATPVAAQSVHAGVEAWQNSDHAKAVAIWRPLAESGNADAAFNIGQAYRLGRGVPQDNANAQYWYDLAAQKGHVGAQTSLGLLLYENGDRPTALRWLKAAADKEEPRAMLVYGTALFNGDGVTQDRTLARSYVSRAADQGLAAAKTTLAEMDKISPPQQRNSAAPNPRGAKGTRKPVEASASATPVRSPRPPKATPRAATRSAPISEHGAATGAWRIQLGAFSQRSSAEALFKRLAHNGPLAGKRPYLAPHGSLTRLQAGPFSDRTSAGAACRILSAKGLACFAVRGK